MKELELNELNKILNAEIEKLTKTKTEKMINAMLETVEMMRDREKEKEKEKKL